MSTIALDTRTAKQKAEDEHIKAAQDTYAKAQREIQKTEAAALKAEREEQSEEEFKQRCRTKYATMPDADFERLWPELRDKELIAQSELTYNKKRAGYVGLV